VDVISVLNLNRRYMIITKNLIWFDEYIQSVSHLLPNVKKLKRISSKTGNKERWQHSHGLITYYNQKNYRITLYTSYHDMISDKIKDYSTLDLLQYLAHELSHLEHWDHTTRHKHLETILMTSFVLRLESKGYESEEDEEKNGLFYKRKHE
jgi:hypothetical protein